MERHLKQFNKSERNISKWNWFSIVLFQGKKKEFAYFELNMEQGLFSNRILKDHRWQRKSVFPAFKNLYEFKCHIIKFKFVVRPTKSTEPWEATSLHQPPSFESRSTHQRCLDSRNQSYFFAYTV